MKTLALFLISLTATQAHPFLPLTDGKAQVAVTGEHWNDAWSDASSSLAAQASCNTLGIFPEGEIVEIVVRTVGQPQHPQEFAVQHWLVTPNGAIFRTDTGRNNEHLAEWKAAGHAAAGAPSELIFPPLDELGRFVASSDKPAQNDRDAPGQQMQRSPQHWAWHQAPWITHVAMDNGSTVRYLTEHPSGHFTKIVWQRGLGIIEMAAGYGAGKHGYRLLRTLAAVNEVSPSKSDVASLFAALPVEFIPSSTAFSQLESPQARANLINAKTEDQTKAALTAIQAQSWSCDRAHGYLQIGSLGDGEGQTLEAALWKRKNGQHLLALHLKQWSAGPEASLNIRLLELHNGQFRDVTWSQLDLPTLPDFYTKENARNAPLGGLIEGDWHLPKTGTTISIEPGSQDAADTIGAQEDAQEAFRFELRWNGNSFKRVALPRRKN